jgi:hypothetical protein
MMSFVSGTKRSSQILNKIHAAMIAKKKKKTEHKERQTP